MPVIAIALGMKIDLLRIEMDRLESNLAVEHHILGGVDGPHATAPEDPNDLVSLGDARSRGHARRVGRILGVIRTGADLCIAERVGRAPLLSRGS